MVPPPTQGLAQRVPKWLDFLLHSHLPLSPGSQGGHWQSCPSILKSQRLPKPLPHTSQSQASQGGEGRGRLRGEPLSCSRHLLPLGLFKLHFFS